MPRDLPIGNGNVLVNFDSQYQIRDIYFPRVGQDNQTVGRVNHLGFWVDGQFSWISEDWHIEKKYLKETLVTDVLLRHDRLGIEARFHDLVDAFDNVLLRELRISSIDGREHQVRVFFHQDFSISENEVGDTAYYDPRTSSVIHYKKNRYFLINTKTQLKTGISDWSVGKKGVDGLEGTYKDAEDGMLGGNPIVQGSVDSTVGLHLNVPKTGEVVGHYWMCLGRSYEEVAKLNAVMAAGEQAEQMVPRNQNYWRLWVNPEHIDFHGLPAKVVELFKRSLLTIRTQVDNGGAIIAANDHDITQFARDTYSYMWPRDGALVAYAMTKAGHRDLTQRFFRFCNEVMKEEGYLMHKYNPDKSVASSWHPWLKDGKEVLPIQEDETALVIWSFWHHFKKFRNIEFVRTVMDKIIFDGADFLCRYRDATTKLPLPSYDLWEERWGVHLFTVSSVIAGLTAAANFCQAVGELTRAHHYQEVAEEVKEAMCEYMWSKEHKRFCRMATRTESGYDLDMTIDAAMYSIFAFGEMNPHDSKVVSTMNAIRERLWIKTEVGGLARYENDYYHQISQDLENVPGNPWFICTMWLAQYDIAAARTTDDLKSAVVLMEWVANRALSSGVLAEQVHPYSNEPLSVSPLTWSHATFVTCVLEYLDRKKQLMTENVFSHTIVPV
ncbi:MAG: glycoside hydrolase family 15 protein [Candidatus Melainabacteria bacterium]|nr:glycoside hydrolase family 15 protein [Candidatus Melainabacteria bacterium]